MDSNNTQQNPTQPEPPRVLNQKFINPNEYLKTLPDADNPEEFLRKIQERGSNVQVPEAEKKVEEVQAKGEISDTKPVIKSEEDSKAPSEDLLFKEEVTTEGLEAKEPIIDIEEEVEDLSEEKISINENYKKLKNKHKETRTRLRELETEAQKLKTDLDEYDKGVRVPEVVQSLESRVNELSKYEKLHNLLESPEYKDNITTPFVNLQEKFFQAAENAGISDETMDEVLASGDKAYIAQFIRKNFDEDTAYQLRQGLKEMDALSEKAIEARKEPERIYQQLKEQSEAAEAIRITETVNRIKDNSRVGFNKALQKIQEEKRFMELVPNPEDNDFNERFVKPLTMDAARSYGRFVNEFAKLGIKELPPEVAEALARTVQLAHVAGSLVESRNAALKGARELAENTRRSTSYERPAIGVSLAPGVRVPEKKEVGGTRQSMEKTADSIISSVLGNRR